MKKLIRIVVIIVVIFTAMIIFAVMNKVDDEKALEGLQTAPISKLIPTGDLAKIFEFGGATTDLQRDNKMKAIKGSVVLWQLPVYEVKRDGENYRVQTQNPNAFGNDEAMVPTIITLTSLSSDDTKTIESLKTGDIISFKGVINDVSLRHLLIKPAFLHDSKLVANEESFVTASNQDTAKEEVANVEAEIETNLEPSAVQITQPEEPSSNWKPSFDCSKAATVVEKLICNEQSLGKLDGALADNYKTMMAADIDDGARADLKLTQKQWLGNRNECTDSQCLAIAYKARIDEVCEYPVIEGIYPICTSADEVNWSLIND